MSVSFSNLQEVRCCCRSAALCIAGVVRVSLFASHCRCTSAEQHNNKHNKSDRLCFAIGDRGTDAGDINK